MIKSHHLYVVACVALTSCTLDNYQRISGQTMGTSYHITARLDQRQLVDLQTKIDHRLNDINQSMSTYDDSSTIMAFNRAGAFERVTIDDDFAKVLTDARKVWHLSDGAFDPTVQPLVLLWGFGKTLTVERLNTPPSDGEISQARALIGLDKVISDGNAIYKTHDGVALDFSAIAKGYGVDVIARVLDDAGITDYMVEIGGEVATRGKNAQGKPWQIGIDTPTPSDVHNRRVLFSITLNDGHLATSGNYRHALEYHGVRYSHTINPHTAYPVANGAPSVSVLADSTALADAWATALTALPYDKAWQMANTQHIAAAFIHQASTHQDTNWQIQKTPAYTQYEHKDTP